jgi:hypothetical protein
MGPAKASDHESPSSQFVSCTVAAARSVSGRTIPSPGDDGTIG